MADRKDYFPLPRPQEAAPYGDEDQGLCEWCQTVITPSRCYKGVCDLCWAKKSGDLS